MLKSLQNKHIQSPPWYTNRFYVTCGILLGIVLISMVYVKPHNDLSRVLQTPSLTHILGTNFLGEDILYLLVMGLRYSILLSLSVVVISVCVGTAIGMIIICNTIAHTVVRTVVNMMIAIPPFIVCLLLISHFGEGKMVLFTGQLLVFLPVCIRIAMQELSDTMASEYAQTAIALGNRPLSVVCKHGLPGLIPALKSQMLSLIAVSIGIESGLSYLGLGMPLPQKGLGQVLHESIGYWSIAPWYPVTTLLFCMALLGCIAWASK